MYRCAQCGAPGLVKQTRTEDGVVRRRYHCSKCRHRFTTAEVLVPEGMRGTRVSVERASRKDS